MSSQVKSIAVIGSGISGISAACFLAQEGFDVTIFEKNDSPGGRARKFVAEGYTFDMGPSWYWMPDVFESFFEHFGKLPSEYYHLTRIDPSYRVFHSHADILDVPAGIPNLCKMFDKLEPGSSRRLLTFLSEGRHKYEIGMGKLAHRPGV